MVDPHQFGLLIKITEGLRVLVSIKLNPQKSLWNMSKGTVELLSNTIPYIHAQLWISQIKVSDLLKHHHRWDGLPSPHHGSNVHHDCHHLCKFYSLSDYRVITVLLIHYSVGIHDVDCHPHDIFSTCGARALWILRNGSYNKFWCQWQQQCLLCSIVQSPPSTEWGQRAVSIRRKAAPCCGVSILKWLVDEIAKSLPRGDDCKSVSENELENY